MIHHLPEALVQMREDAKKCLYIGDLAQLRENVEYDLAKFDVCSGEMMDLIASHASTCSKHTWVVAAIDDVAQHVNGDRRLASNMIALYLVESRADSLCNVVCALQELENDARGSTLLRPKISAAKRDMALFLDDFAKTLSQLSGVNKIMADVAIDSYLCAIQANCGQGRGR